MSTMGGRETEEGSCRPGKRQRVGCTQRCFGVAYPFSDVKLVSGSGAVLYGCRYNLALWSPVCERMLLSEMKEKQPMSEVVTIPFPGTRTKVLQVLLDFCTYNGRFSNKLVRNAPVDVIHAARYFQLTDDIHMEELMAKVVAKVSALASGNDWGDGDFPMYRLVRMLSLALECLSTDLDAPLFELLVRMILSRGFDAISYKTSSKALEFLLSKTMRCREPWASTFPFRSSEISTFHFVLRWSVFRIPGHRNKDLLDNWIDHGIPDILEDADLLESIATLAQPFLPSIDFCLIDPGDIVRLIKPLKVVPGDMLLEALCHHAQAPSMSKPIFYRGSYVLQWHPDAHSPGLVIDEKSGGRVLYSDSKMTGFARAYSSFRDSGEHSWIVTISNPSRLWSGIGVGFCSDEVNYSQWLGHSSNGWIMDCSAMFWHNGNREPAAHYGTPFRSWGVKEVLVTVNLDRGTCYFKTRLPSDSRGTWSDGHFSSAGPWPNFPKLLYPAVSFRKSAGRVSIRALS